MRKYMRERVLRDFFEGKATAAELAREVACATEHLSDVTSVISIEDMDGEFTVTAAMAVRLCDAVIGGALPPDALATIGFALQASDAFCWNSDDDEVLAEVLADWSAPQVNYALTTENVQRFRCWLLRSEAYPERKTRTAPSPRSLIFVTEKRFVRPWWKRMFARE